MVYTVTEFDTKYVDNPMMPWGKYGVNGDEGHTAIKDLPDSYLLWLLEKAENDNLYPKWLNQVIRDTWKARNG